MFTQRLKQLRADSGLSQRALSEILHVSQQTVAKWESGGATPNPDMLAQIATHFGVSVDYLIGRSDALTNDEMIKFALFGGSAVDDEIYEEVKRFAKYAAEQRGIHSPENK